MLACVGLVLLYTLDAFTGILLAHTSGSGWHCWHGAHWVASASTHGLGLASCCAARA